MVLYIDEATLDEGMAAVFKLTDLAQLYQSRMEELGLKLDGRVQAMQLKERLLIQFPDM